MNTPAAEAGMAIWDVVVIGGGAAGLCAAARTGMSCLVIDRMGGGGELMNLRALQDFNELSSGPDPAARLLEDATAAGAELEISEATGLARRNSCSTSPQWSAQSLEHQTTFTASLLAGLG